MAHRPRQARNDGVRQLLIDYREHALPKSTPPPPWSAPRGRRDELLDDLKAGRSVIVGSATLLCAMMAAELPEAAYRRFCYGGPDYDLTWLTFRVLAWLRPVDVLFCVRIRRNLNTKVGP